jgi:hypothetical protein
LLDSTTNATRAPTAARPTLLQFNGSSPPRKQRGQTKQKPLFSTTTHNLAESPTSNFGLPRYPFK